MILFVCSVARLRSRTAELLCLFGGVDARCCGTSDVSLVQVTDSMLRQADMVFCMESSHKKYISEFSHYEAEKTFVLGIEDDYERLEPSLVQHLIHRVAAKDEELASKMKIGYELLKNTDGYLKSLGTYNF